MPRCCYQSELFHQKNMTKRLIISTTKNRLFSKRSPISNNLHIRSKVGWMQHLPACLPLHLSGWCCPKNPHIGQLQRGTTRKITRKREPACVAPLLTARSDATTAADADADATAAPAACASSALAASLRASIALAIPRLNMNASRSYRTPSTCRRGKGGYSCHAWP